MIKRVHGTKDENIFKTRTVCRTNVLCWSLQSDQCITKYTDSKEKSDQRRKPEFAPDKIPDPGICNEPIAAVVAANKDNETDRDDEFDNGPAAAAAAAVAVDGFSKNAAGITAP